MEEPVLWFVYQLARELLSEGILSRLGSVSDKFARNVLKVRYVVLEAVGNCTNETSGNVKGGNCIASLFEQLSEIVVARR